MLSRTINLQPLGAILENGDEFSFQRHFHYEYLDYYFEVYDEAVIPVGSHKFSHWYVRYESVKSRAVSVDLMTSWGGFYNGRRKYYSAAFTFKFNRFLAVTSDISMYDIDLKDDSFIARNASLKLQTNLSTRLTSSTFVQWNNHEGEANMNFRIHYIPQIGSDIYIAYNQIWDEEDDMRTLYNAGIVKVDYLLRF